MQENHQRTISRLDIMQPRLGEFRIAITEGCRLIGRHAGATVSRRDQRARPSAENGNIGPCNTLPLALPPAGFKLENPRVYGGSEVPLPGFEIGAPPDWWRSRTPNWAC